MVSAETDFLAAGTPLFDGAESSPPDLRAAWRSVLSPEGASTDGSAIARAIASRVRGDFAVGWTDADGRTILAIDRFATRTLCYRIVDGRLQFAERADRLVEPGAAIDPQAIFDYLYFHSIPSPRTVWAGVFRLPPGHLACFDHGDLTVMPYWRAAFEPPSRASFTALRDEFRTLLANAVRRQLDRSRPACFLSGGTDSSTVAGLIGQIAGRPAASYSIGFDAEGYDEMAYARLAARHFRCEHHEYYVTPDDVARSLREVAIAHDQPFGNSSLLPAYHCALVARGDGVSRLIAGDGGDELFGGNARYAVQRIFSWYPQVPGAFRRGVMEPTLRRRSLHRVPLMRRAASYVEQANVPMPDRLQMYNLLRRLGMETVLTPAFLARVQPADVLRQQRKVWQAADAVSETDRTLAFDWRYTLAESDLPKVRGAVQLAGLDVGFPMLDDDLLAFSMRLPAEYKLKGLKLRWFFKEALRGFLPEEILRKKKQGFGLPFGVWVGRHAALNRLAKEALDSLSTRGIVRPAFLRALLEDLLPQHPGYYGEMVWILTVLEYWLQRNAATYAVHDGA